MPPYEAKKKDSSSLLKGTDARCCQGPQDSEVSPACVPQVHLAMDLAMGFLLYEPVTSVSSGENRKACCIPRTPIWHWFWDLCVIIPQLFWLLAQPSPWQRIFTIILSAVGTEPCLMRYHPCSVNPTEARFTVLAKHSTDSRGSGSVVPGPQGN